MKHRTKKSWGTLNIYKTENDIPRELRLKLNVLANQNLAESGGRGSSPDADKAGALERERPALYRAA